MTLILIVAVGVVALFLLIGLVSAFAKRQPRDAGRRDDSAHTYDSSSTWVGAAGASTLAGSTSSDSSDGDCNPRSDSGGSDSGSSDTGSCDSGGGDSGGGGDGGGGGGGD